MNSLATIFLCYITRPYTSKTSSYVFANYVSPNLEVLALTLGYISASYGKSKYKCKQLSN